MQKNVLEWVEASAKRYRDKIAFSSELDSVTFFELKCRADAIGSALIQMKLQKQPIAVFLPKTCKSIEAFMGIVSAGGFYCPIDTEIPNERIQKIFNVLQPSAIITDPVYKNRIPNFELSYKILDIDELEAQKVHISELEKVKTEMIDIDPLYILFTSGSTGDPKGVLVSHRSVIDYIDWVVAEYDFTYQEVFGNQAPFYFDNSVLDIYSTLKTGATMHIIPKNSMIFPDSIFHYLEIKKITTIFWVPSLLSSIVILKGFTKTRTTYLNKVLFAGEVMPNKHLNIWRKYLPNVLYANLYGPTEITVDCTYFTVNREFNDDEPLPIGKACNNTKIIVLTDEGREAEIDEPGELCVSGSCLSLGYYNNPEMTKSVFVQNPLNPYYEEKIYKTGDIVKKNSAGELIYLSRKDHQIKFMGHRIELGEIETALSSFSDITNCICLYNEKLQQIIGIYTGTVSSDSELRSHLKAKIPEYMIPSRFIHRQSLPYNANGKIDRKKLQQMIETESEA